MSEQYGTPIEAMSPTQKRAYIAESFPIEVPVPSGTVARGMAQGADAWDYEVVVDTSPDALAAWYRDAYGSRSWEIVGDVSGGDGSASRYEITFRKGAAESRVIVSPADSGAKAAVILGVGVPVLQTQ